MTTLKRKVASGLAWSGIAKLIAQLLSWLSTFVVIRYLSPDDYAIVGLAFAFTGFFYVLSEFGLADALIQQKTTTDKNYSQVFSATLLLNAGVFSLFIVISSFFADFYQNEALAAVLIFIAANLLLSSFIIIPETLMNKAMRFKRRALLETIASTLNTLTTLALAVSGFGYWSILIGQAVNTLSRVLLFNGFGYHNYKLTFNFKGFGSLLSFGGYTFASRAVWALYNKLDILVIGRVFGAQLLGIYTVAVQLSSMPLEKMSGIINQVAFTAFSQSGENEQHFLFSLRLLSVALFPVFIGIAAISPVLIPLLIGDQWLESVILIQLLSLIMPLKLISSFVNTYIASKGDAKFNLKMSMLYLGFISGGLMIGSFGDYIDTVIALVVAYIFCFILVSVLSMRKIKCSFNLFIGCLWRPVLCSLLMWLSLFLLSNQASLTLSPVFNTLLMVALGILSYTILSLVFAREHVTDMINLFHQAKH
ncbi:MAG: lipopolysaccharide biosynthesis protein [Colwellia sp.]